MSELGRVLLAMGEFLAGYGWCAFTARRRAKRAQPYSWICFGPDCGFKVDSNSVEALMQVADRHRQFHGWIEDQETS